MFTVISYDVVNDKRRTRVMKLLKGYGAHVQYSVFECDLTAQQFERLRHELLDLIDRTTDSVRCYLLDTAAVQRVRVLGIGQVTSRPRYIMVGGTPTGSDLPARNRVRRTKQKQQDLRRGRS